MTARAGLATTRSALGRRLRLPRLRSRRPARSLRRPTTSTSISPTAPTPDSGLCRYKGVPVACGPPGLHGRQERASTATRGNGTFEDVSEQRRHHARQRHLRPRRQHARLRRRRLDRSLRGERLESERALPQQPRRHVHGRRASRPAAPTARTASRRPAWASRIGDYDRNGTIDIFKTNFAGDTSTLYANSGDGLLRGPDVRGRHRPEHALARLGRRRSSISTTTAGSISSSSTATSTRRSSSSRPRPATSSAKVVYRNLGNGRFQDVTERLGRAGHDTEGRPRRGVRRSRQRRRRRRRRQQRPRRAGSVPRSTRDRTRTG